MQDHDSRPLDEATDDAPQTKELPFDNLYLNSGFVNGQNQWWMYVLTILVTALTYLLAPAITSFYLFIRATSKGVSETELIENSNKLFDYRIVGVDKNVVVLALLGIFVITALGFVTMLRRVHHKTLTSVLTGYERFRTGRFWFAFAVWGAQVVITALVGYFSDPGSVRIIFDPFGFTVSLLMLFFLMPIQTGIEEVLFRGYLVQGLSLLFRNGLVPLLITSFLFGSAHMSNPEVTRHGWPIMLTYYSAFGFFMGAITLIDEGLELAIGIHFANNFISSLLVTTPEGVLQTHAIFETSEENPYIEMLLWVAMAAITFAIFCWRYRWKNFKLLIR